MGAGRQPVGKRTLAFALLAALLIGDADALAGARKEHEALGPAHTLQSLEQRVYTYRDHLERTSRRVSLQEALALGLAQNPSLAKAYALIEATAWDGVAIRREWFPSLTAGNNDPGLVGVQQQQANILSISSPELTLEWTFFDPSRHPRAQANAASLAADRFLFDVQARSLVLTIQQQYIDLQTLLELEGEYRKLSSLVEEWRTLAKAQGRRGASTPDVDQLTGQALALLILRIDTHEQGDRSGLQPGPDPQPSPRGSGDAPRSLAVGWPMGSQPTGHHCPGPPVPRGGSAEPGERPGPVLECSCDPRWLPSHSVPGGVRIDGGEQ